jgi:hypothetical protein
MTNEKKIGEYTYDDLKHYFFCNDLLKIGDEKIEYSGALSSYKFYKEFGNQSEAYDFQNFRSVNNKTFEEMRRFIALSKHLLIKIGDSELKNDLEEELFNIEIVRSNLPTIRLISKIFRFFERINLEVPKFYNQSK